MCYDIAVLRAQFRVLGQSECEAEGTAMPPELIPKLPDLAMKAVRIFEIALVFELLVFFIGKRVDYYIGPLLGAGAGRDPTWRLRRRNKLRSGPRGVLRVLMYTLAFLMIFAVFDVPMEPVYLAVLAVVIAASVILRPLFQDMCAGYIILAEDRFAPGDQIKVGEVVGTVEGLTLRQTTLRDAQNSEVVHLLPNREVTRLTVRRPVQKPARPTASDDKGTQRSSGKIPSETSVK